MPRGRKTKPPLINLHIERLSDGVNPTLKDDWTGELISQPNAKPPHDPRPQQARDKATVRANQLQMLNALGITHEGYKPHGPAAPKPKHNEVHTESKLVLSVKPNLNPSAIKRRF